VQESQEAAGRLKWLSLVGQTRRISVISEVSLVSSAAIGRIKGRLYVAS